MLLKRRSIDNILYLCLGELFKAAANSRCTGIKAKVPELVKRCSSAVGIFLKPTLLWLARESVKGKGETHVEEKRHVSRPMEGWEDDFIVILYTPSSTVH